MFFEELQKPDGRRLTLYAREPISKNIKPTNPPHDGHIGASHMRWHPLRGEWVVYASHRQNRTFLPPKEYSPLAVTSSPEFPTEMPAGNYDVAVFDNLFPSLSEVESDVENPGKGVCEVVVFTQEPDTSLAALPLEQVAFILKVLAHRTRVLKDRGTLQYMMPFENRGVEVGVTLHHPHGQIYAYPFIPPLPAKMGENQKKHLSETGKNLLEQIIADEIQNGSRVVTQSERAVSFIPTCARYPYETWIAPKRRASHLFDLNDAEILDLATTLKTTLMKYDAMWSKPFPYLMVFYQAPLTPGDHSEWYTHIQISPPYRTKDRLKFLAGTELGAGVFVNDSLPEEKAAELRAVEVSID